MENLSSNETRGARGSQSPANHVPTCCLLSEGHAGRVHELLLWCERVHRYRRLLYCDDETCLETLTERYYGKRAPAPGSERRARATFDHEVFSSSRTTSHLPRCFSLMLCVAWFECMRPDNIRKERQKAQLRQGKELTMQNHARCILRSEGR